MKKAAPVRGGILIAVAFSLVTLSATVSARTYQEVPELAKCFQDAGVAVTFVLFDVTNDKMLVCHQITRMRKV